MGKFRGQAQAHRHQVLIIIPFHIGAQMLLPFSACAGAPVARSFETAKCAVLPAPKKLVASHHESYRAGGYLVRGAHKHRAIIKPRR